MTYQPPELLHPQPAAGPSPLEGTALLDGPGPDAVLVSCTDGYAHLHGRTPQQLTGQTMPGVPDGPTVTRTLPDGRTVTLDVTRSALTLGGRVLTLENVRAVSLRPGRPAPDRDAPTGLGDRRAFEQDLEEELARAARHRYPVTVLTADLDGLKRVNDEHGHARGDDLLGTFARELRGQFRASDRLYRLGGDEFAAILAHADTTNVAQILMRVTAAMTHTRHATGLPGADVSAGYATFPGDSGSPGDLIRLANERMYGQKRAHRGVRPGQDCVTGQLDHTVQTVAQRTVRMTFALLAQATDPSAQDWAALLEAAVLTVPDAAAGQFWVRGPAGPGLDAFQLRAVTGLPDTDLGLTRTPDDTLALYGASAHDWQHGRPNIHARTDTDGAASPSTMDVPVVAEREVLAHLHLQGTPGRTFGPAATHAALEFAQQLAALLAGCARTQRETRRRQELETLAALNVALGRARTPAAVETVLTEQAASLLAAQTATYLKYDPVTDSLVPTVTVGRARTGQSALPRGVGVPWDAAERACILRSDDTHRDHPAPQHGRPGAALATLHAPLVSSSGQLLGVLAVGREASPFSDLDVTLAQAMTGAAATSLERSVEAVAVHQARTGALHAVGLALEARDFESPGHTARVVALAERFAESLALDADQKEALREGAYLHDIGKLSLPDEVLLKPGALTPQERVIMQTHARIGYDLSRSLPTLPEASLLIRHHHEWWNGSGYPDGLAGQHIPYLARVFTLVDVYDALTSDLPYKRAWTPREAAHGLRSLSGTQFDPTLLKAFLSLLKL
ncbi:HD domain-containing phosphohydrolase [Deinococcus aquiradiocola]|nr:HD domain-containing phosphohydrolase [Deinococcus aquiradiocola]